MDGITIIARSEERQDIGFVHLGVVDMKTVASRSKLGENTNDLRKQTL